MAKPVHLRTHTLSDEIVLNGIKAINCIKNERNVEGHISGGIAVQSYLPQSHYRSTVDLDFDLMWGGSPEEFRSLSQPMFMHLQQLGYQLQLKKKGFTFDTYVWNEADSFMIQHIRRSKRNFETSRISSLEREVAHQRIVNKEGTTYAVLSPEDLAVHKASRILNFEENFGSEIPKGGNYQSFKAAADELREAIRMGVSEIGESDISQLRVFFDCYDISCLSACVGLNGPYIEEAIRDFKESSKQSRIHKLFDRLDLNIR